MPSCRFVCVWRRPICARGRPRRHRLERSKHDFSCGPVPSMPVGFLIRFLTWDLRSQPNLCAESYATAVTHGSLYNRRTGRRRAEPVPTLPGARHAALKRDATPVNLFVRNFHYGLSTRLIPYALATLNATANRVPQFSVPRRPPRGVSCRSPETPVGRNWPCFHRCWRLVSGQCGPRRTRKPWADSGSAKPSGFCLGNALCR